MDKNGDYKSAHQYYNKALQISSAINFHDLTNFIYGNLSKVHRKRGNLDSAIIYMELQQAMKDSIFDFQKTKEYAEIKEKYESELKEEKIRSLNNKIELAHQKDQKRVYFFTAIIAGLGALLLLAAIVGIVIYNAQQKKLAKEKIDEERLRNKMIIEAEEKERTRIAKDLHDSLGQMLAALKMNLNSLSGTNSNDQFKKTTQILDDTIVEMRSISHAMMPESLVKNGLAQALMDISNHVETNQTKVNVSVENWKGWTSTGEYVLYRITQELLNNTLKHADAKNVHIELNQFDDEINLIYEDDGKGFDLSSVQSDGIGLANMNNRISSINGHIEFDSKPGAGTTAIISIPLK
jgi:signal transduction histidine kinase